MSDCVKETLCTHCIHREVCSIKMAYLDTLNKLPAINSDFKLTLSCKHYSQEVLTPRMNMPNYNPVSTGPDRLELTYSDSTNILRG